MAALWKLYDEHGGNIPEHKTIVWAATEYSLSEDQIYKWFWDTKKKLSKGKPLRRPEDKCQQEEGWNSDFESLAV